MRGILIVAGIAVAACFVVTALIMLGASVNARDIQAKRHEEQWNARRAMENRVRARRKAEQRLAALRNRNGGTPAA